MTGRHAPNPLTNRALGVRIGVSPSMASRLRNGKRRPGAATMVFLAAELGISLGALLEAHGKGPEACGRLIRKALA